MTADAAGRMSVDLTAKLKDLAKRCTAYAQADARHAVIQLVTTVSLLFVVVAAMLACVQVAVWATLLLAPLAALLVVRLFIFQHDCGHGSFFRTRLANDVCGRCLSLVTLTPYGLWKREHAHHHASCGNLERRGVGDIETLTVKEYRSRSLFGRLLYRIYRHPLFLFGFGIPFYFLVLQRTPWAHGLPASDAWKSVLALDAALLTVYGGLAAVFGISELLLVVVPIVFIAAAAGGWLFFIQHQFDGAYWEHAGDWNFQAAAVYGSSYYVLPALLNWFTGHIGLHHIHHLNSMIPNYRLKDCLEASAELSTMNRITLWESLSCARLKLWDAQKRRLVTFAEASA